MGKDLKRHIESGFVPFYLLELLPMLKLLYNRIELNRIGLTTNWMVADLFRKYGYKVQLVQNTYIIKK